MTEAFWIQEGDELCRATMHTQGPWNPHFQHGGPPAALLVRQLETWSPREDMVLARVSIDILAPVPIATCIARARALRPDRSVELLEARYEGRRVMRATGWRVRLPKGPRRRAGFATTAGGQTHPSIASLVTSGFLYTEWRTVREDNEHGRATAGTTPLSTYRWRGDLAHPTPDQYRRLRQWPELETRYWLLAVYSA